MRNKNEWLLNCMQGPYLGMITASFTLNCELAPTTFVSRMSPYIINPIWSFSILFSSWHIHLPVSGWLAKVLLPQYSKPTLVHLVTLVSFFLLYAICYCILDACTEGCLIGFSGHKVCLAFQGAPKASTFFILSWVQHLPGRDFSSGWTDGWVVSCQLPWESPWGRKQI